MNIIRLFQPYLKSIFGLSNLLISLSLTLFACTTNRFLIEQEMPSTAKTTFSFDLSNSVKEHWSRFEFAADGSEYVLISWLTPYKDLSALLDIDRVLMNCIVLDFKGMKIDATEFNGKELKDRYLRLFPENSYRQKWQEFIQSAFAWGFSDDDCYGIRFIINNTTRMWDAELWKFCDKSQSVWKVNKLTQGGVPLTEFIKYEDQDSILIAFTPAIHGEA